MPRLLIILVLACFPAYPIAIVQTVCGASPLTLPSVVSGHGLVYIGFSASSLGISVSDSLGNTITQDPKSPVLNGPAIVQAFLYYVTASASGNNVVTLNNIRRACVYELNSSITRNNSRSSVFNNITTPSAGSIVLSATSTFLVGSGSSANGTVLTWSVTNSYTLDFSTSSGIGPGGVESKIVASAATYPDGWSLNTMGSGSVILGAFQSSGTNKIRHQVSGP
jgi:hypothetical protein